MSVRVRRGRNWLIQWVLLCGLWALLGGSSGAVELMGGAVAAAIAATGVSLVQARDNVRLAIRPSWATLLMRRLPRQVVGDCVRVIGTLPLLVLGKPVKGRLRRFGFDSGLLEDPLAAGRRALVVVAVSVAPNAVVVRIDGTDLIVHQLLPAPRPNDREWPL